MEFKNIYTGLPVRSTKEEGIYEILTIDDYSMSVWCRKINSIDMNIVEFKISELKEL